MATKGISADGKIILAKPNYSPRQHSNTEFVSGTGWVFTDPLTGNKETLVSVKGSNYTSEEAVATAAAEEEETEESE